MEPETWVRTHHWPLCRILHVAATPSDAIWLSNHLPCPWPSIVPTFSCHPLIHMCQLWHFRRCSVTLDEVASSNGIISTHPFLSCVLVPPMFTASMTLRLCGSSAESMAHRSPSWGSVQTTEKGLVRCGWGRHPRLLYSKKKADITEQGGVPGNWQSNCDASQEWVGLGACWGRELQTLKKQRGRWIM